MGDVLNEPQRVFPKAATDTALRTLVLKLPRHSRPPANSIVSADHVGDRGNSLPCPEPAGSRYHVGDLIATPAMPLNADGLFVHKALIDHFLKGRQNTVKGTLAGIAHLVCDIRFQNEIAVADIDCRID